MVKNIFLNFAGFKLLFRSLPDLLYGGSEHFKIGYGLLTAISGILFCFTTVAVEAWSFQTNGRGTVGLF